MLLLGVLVLDLLVLSRLFSAGSGVGILFREGAGNLDRNIVAQHNHIILACNVNTKFLGSKVSKELMRYEKGHMKISHNLNSNSSLSMLLMNAPFELLTSLIKVRKKTSKKVISLNRTYDNKLLLTLPLSSAAN